MSARDVVAVSLHNHGIAFPTPEEVTDWIVKALTDAGYRILGPDELETIRDSMQMAISSMEGDCEAHHKIALNTLDRAIRSLIPAQPEAKEAPQPNDHETICPSCDGTGMNLYDGTNFDCQICSGRGHVSTQQTGAEAIQAKEAPHD